MPTCIYRRSVAMLLATLTALTAIAISSNPAEAHRYRRHNNGALAFGIATAVIAGIAVSRHHRHHRRYYYNGYSRHRWGHRHNRKFRYGHVRHRRHW